MSLTREDLQAIASLIGDSEGRMIANTQKSIGDSEGRMIANTQKSISESESRTKGEISDLRNHMMTYFESKVEKQIKQIADGHIMLAEKMDRMNTKMDTMQEDINDIKATVIANEIIITNKYKIAE